MGKNIISLVDELFQNGNLDDDGLLLIINSMDEAGARYLAAKADEKRRMFYSDKVFMRGLIEFTNICSRNCVYCGIRGANKSAHRYRLTEKEILKCCEEGYALGYKTFVLQGGEDWFFTDEVLCGIVETIKSRYEDAAITLSVGERSFESYKALYDAGADRYLLRHETASRNLYEKLHPGMSMDDRIGCLHNLKKIGFQVGGGFMVGLPGQNDKDLVKDLRFIKDFDPHMVGIGPFIPHKDTDLRDEPGGTVDKTLLMLSLTRLLIPKALIPATTALGTIDVLGREKAIKAGANVVMPNLSPIDARSKYALYDNKICTGDEAAHCRSCIQKRIEKAGYRVDMNRGDHYEHK